MSGLEEVRRSDAEHFASEYNLSLCFISAKENTGIQVNLFLKYQRKCLGKLVRK